MSHTFSSSNPPHLSDAIQVWPYVWAHDTGRYLLFVGFIVVCLTLWRLIGAKHAQVLTNWQARQVSIRSKRPWQRLKELAWSLHAALVFSVIGTGVWWGARSGVFQLYQDISMYGYTYAAASLAAIIVLHDAYFYWMHRFMHRPGAMRWIHRVHHQSHSPTPWTAYAFDTLDAIAQALFLPMVLLFLPVHEIVALLWMTHQIIRNAMGHSGVEPVPLSWLRGWWGRWLTTTLHHEMHHAHVRGNYGLWFRWWDQLCGTEHPQYAEELAKLCQRIEAAQNLDVKPFRTKRSTEKALLVAALTAGLLVIAFSFQSNSHAQGSAAVVTKTSILGDWATQGYGARVRVRPCEANPEQICGAVTWLWDPLGKDGKPLLDVQNSDVSLQGRPVIGLDIIHGFSPTGQSGQWGQGKIYNPADGRTYNAKIKQRSADILELEGCMLMFCAKQIWRRLPPNCQP